MHKNQHLSSTARWIKSVHPGHLSMRGVGSIQRHQVRQACPSFSSTTQFFPSMGKIVVPPCCPPTIILATLSDFIHLGTTTVLIVGRNITAGVTTLTIGGMTFPLVASTGGIFIASVPVSVATVGANITLSNGTNCSTSGNICGHVSITSTTISPDGSVATIVGDGINANSVVTFTVPGSPSIVVTPTSASTGTLTVNVPIGAISGTVSAAPGCQATSFCLSSTPTCTPIGTITATNSVDQKSVTFTGTGLSASTSIRLPNENTNISGVFSSPNSITVARVDFGSDVYLIFTNLCCDPVAAQIPCLSLGTDPTAIIATGGGPGGTSSVITVTVGAGGAISPFAPTMTILINGVPSTFSPTSQTPTTLTYLVPFVSGITYNTVVTVFNGPADVGQNGCFTDITLTGG